MSPLASGTEEPQVLPSAGNRFGYPTTTTRASGLRRSMSVSMSGTRVLSFAKSASRFLPLLSSASRQGVPSLVDSPASTQVVSTSEKPRSLPPRVTVTRSVSLVRAAICGAADPCLFHSERVVAPLQVTSLNTVGLYVSASHDG